MNKFFVSSNDIKDSFGFITDKEDVKHLSKILRMKIGEEVLLSDGTEWEYLGIIDEISKDAIKVQITDKQKNSREPKNRITLYQGVPKGSKMDLIVQKNVELGIDSIVPVFMDRTVVVPKKNFSSKIDRWQKIGAEAAKQCKRNIIPEVRNSIDFKEMIDEFSDYNLVIFPYENQDDRSIKDLLEEYSKTIIAKDEVEFQKASKIAIIIGPEGGFSDKEADSIVESGGESVTLGKTILRTETAGFTAVAMTMYALEL